MGKIKMRLYLKSIRKDAQNNLDVPDLGKILHKWKGDNYDKH